MKAKGVQGNLQVRKGGPWTNFLYLQTHGEVREKGKFNV